jgi:hypothetical protein
VTPLTHHLSTDLNFRSDQVIRIPTATGRHVGETCKTEAPILLIQTGSLSPNEIRYPLKQYIPSAVIQNKICKVFDKEMCRVGASVPRLLASSILKLHFQLFSVHIVCMIVCRRYFRKNKKQMLMAYIRFGDASLIGATVRIRSPDSVGTYTRQGRQVRKMYN